MQNFDQSHLVSPLHSLNLPACDLADHLSISTAIAALVVTTLNDSTCTQVSNVMRVGDAKLSSAGAAGEWVGFAVICEAQVPELATAEDQVQEACEKRQAYPQF